MNEHDKILIELGEFLEEKIKEKQIDMYSKGIKKRLSNKYIANQLKISNTWFSQILKGEKEANDEILLNLSSILNIDEHELFKKARKIHPVVYEKCKREYLGEYYIN